MSDFSALKEELLATNDEFRRLQAEHRESERRLEELYRKSLRSPEDEQEEKRIKLHKLRLKDEMEHLLRTFATAPAAV